MANDRFPSDELDELRETSEAAAALARDPDAFTAAYEAFLKSDADRFRAALERLDLEDRCPVICRFFCRKHCATLCRRFCPDHSTCRGQRQHVSAGKLDQRAARAWRLFTGCRRHRYVA